MRQSLSPRECEIAQRLAKGQSFKWAADQMHISQNTARTIAKRAYAKCGIHSADELVRVHGKHEQMPAQRCYRITKTIKSLKRAHEQLGRGEGRNWRDIKA